VHVDATDPAFAADAIRLARETPDVDGFIGQVGPGGFSVRQSGSALAPLTIDFTDGRMRQRRRTIGRRQALPRAVGIKPGKTLSVIDCTAGLGRDALVLASLGCVVTMIERSAVLSQMLESAVERAKAVPDLADAIARMTLVSGEAESVLAALETPPDVIYIDPMFPPRDKSALVKREMQLLHTLVGTDEDVFGLLGSAVATGCRRIVVKRPRGARISGIEPDFVVRGKTTDYVVVLSAAVSR
jgi:16S rRNA (guanine1516-N2)-methyltransferase